MYIHKLLMLKDIWPKYMYMESMLVQLGWQAVIAKTMSLFPIKHGAENYGHVEVLRTSMGTNADKRRKPTHGFACEHCQ